MLFRSSRITGYYRPVQNWNDGKISEYNNRKLYDVKELRDKKGTVVRKEASGEKVECASDANGRYLFTTKTCPNCAAAKKILKEARKDYVLIDAEENMTLAQKYGVMQAPTLVVVRDGAAKKYVNASNIGKYASGL